MRYLRTDNYDDALLNFNKAIDCEKQLQNSGLEMDASDILDISRLYKGRARTYVLIREESAAIEDYCNVLRMYRDVFNDVPESQKYYYATLNEVTEYVIEVVRNENILSSMLQEFLYSMKSLPKTDDAIKIEQEIFSMVEDLIG